MTIKVVRCLLCVLLLTAISMPPIALGSVQFYLDEDAWKADMGSWREFQFTAATTPVNAPVMEFPGSLTGMGVDVALESKETPPVDLVGFAHPTLGFMIAPNGGGQNLGNKEDWAATFTGSDIYAFGVIILDNNEEFEHDEWFKVIGDGWQDIIHAADEPDDWVRGNEQPFIGVISTLPISQVWFNDGAVQSDDNIGLTKIFTPEPSTLPLLIVSGIIAMRRKR